MNIDFPRRSLRARTWWLRVVQALASAAIVLIASVSITTAQTSGKLTSGSLRQQIEQRLQVLDDDTSLPGDVRTRAQKTLHDALLQSDRADLFREQTRQFTDATLGAAQRERELQQLNAAPTVLPSRPEGRVNFEQVQAALEEAQAALDASTRALSTARADQGTREVRRRSLPEELRTASQSLADLQAARASLPTDGDPAVLGALTLLRQAETTAAERQVEMLQTELRSYEAREELLRLRLEIHERDAEAARQMVDELRRMADAQRALDLREQRRQVAQDVTDLEGTPQLQALAEEALALLDTRHSGKGGVASAAAETRQQLNGDREALERLRLERQRIDRRLQISGVNSAVGLLLRDARSRLPDVRRLRAALRRNQQVMTELQLQLVEQQERQSETTSLDQRAQNLWQAMGNEEPATDAQLAPTRALLQRNQELRSALIHDLLEYFDVMVELDAVQRQLLDEATTLKAFVDERVLWVRSSAPLGATGLSRVPDGLRWLTLPAHWREALAAARADLDSNGLLWFAAAAFIGTLVVARRQVPKLMRMVAAQLADRPGQAFTLSLRALLWTILGTLPVPCLIGFVGWRLHSSSVGFGAHLGAGLRWAAAAILFVDFARQLCRSSGLASVHLRWPADAMPMSRRLAARWMASAAPLLTAVEILTTADDASLEPLARLLFIAALAITAIVLYRLVTWRPSDDTGAPPPGRYRRLAGVVIVALPIALAIASLIGFHFTAAQLSRRLALTAVALGLLAIVEATVQLWLAVARQQLVIERRKQRREAMAAAAAAAEAGGEPVSLPAEIPTSEIRRQSRDLLRTVVGLLALATLYAVWADVLTALVVVQRVTLWGKAVEAGGHGVVTLGNVLLAVGVLVVTFVATRNLPGLLEVVLLRRLPLDAGSRFAAVQVARYGILAAGLILMAPLLGLHWASVQWLLAAMTVGLGFGLQEIFANFVSGVIILFERPMRVGDTVTIGGVTGTVTRIRIRATTITDFERKELIVPNKEFITGQLINWTLSDDVLRITIKVGIAYGSDTHLARKILTEAAAAVPEVLKEPPHQIWFQNFGDSCLDFELRVFVHGPGHTLVARDALNEYIDAAFRQAGIEIAFPQRDLHLRSMPATVAGSNAAIEPADPTAGSRAPAGGTA